MTDAAANQFYLSHLFTIELPALKTKVTGISSISGLNHQVEVIESKTVGEFGQEIIKKTPGRLQTGTINVKRPLSKDKALWDWAKLVNEGKMKEARVDGAVVLYDLEGKESGRWTFEQAWPSKWSASDLDAGSDDPMTEEVEIQIEYLKRDK